MINIAVAQHRGNAAARRSGQAQLRVLSLGAGVQSTTLALMMAHGEVAVPDAAIFADTQWEPAAVYAHLQWLMSPGVLPFPVYVVTAGDIRVGIRERRAPSSAVRFAAVPWHIMMPDGTTAMGARQCTKEYKLTPITREIRRLLGKGPRESIARNSVEVMIGISIDESHRMKVDKRRYLVNRYPLVECGMSRDDCVRWLADRGYPEPPKSACVGCPYTDDERWLDRKLNHPDEFAEAVEYDHLLRLGDPRGMVGMEYMHRSLRPLDEVDFVASAKEKRPSLFGNECEGMCGV